MAPLKSALLLLLAGSGLAVAQGSTSAPRVIVRLKDAVAKEVQAEGFTLAQGTRVHLTATGQGFRMGGSPFSAYGWILNARTREVVWQMNGKTSQRSGQLMRAEQDLDLPAGSYEAYFANASYGHSGLFGRGTTNIDRRRPQRAVDETHDHGFLENLFGRWNRSARAAWREEAPDYGLELRVEGPGAAGVTTFTAPLAWQGELLNLRATADGVVLRQSFRLRKSVSLHVYAVGERGSGSRMADGAWILDAKTRKPVWEMNGDLSDYAGGASKNRRRVETLTLPAGDYVAVSATDGSHSPADWNSAPPCDPLRYGLTLSVTRPEDQAAVQLLPSTTSPAPLAELVRVGNDQDRSVAFQLKASTRVRIFALGEADGDEMADHAWIEDAAGTRVWSMRPEETVSAGGARKNRLAEAVLSLPKGNYTLHVRTDGSHAYGDWNDTPPWDAERYGITIYPAD